jgi:hypothetical protein
MNGHGIYKWPNGAVYEGNFENDLRHGHGILKEADGKSYDVEYKNDEIQKIRAHSISVIDENLKIMQVGNKRRLVICDHIARKRS